MHHDKASDELHTGRHEQFSYTTRPHIYQRQHNTRTYDGPTTNKKDASSLVLQLPAGGGIDAPKPIDRVVIEEDQAYGQRILAWNVSTDTGVVLGSGKSVGNKRILVWNSTALPADAKQLVLGVTTAKAQPVIRNFAAFRSCPVE